MIGKIENQNTRVIRVFYLASDSFIPCGPRFTVYNPTTITHHLPRAPEIHAQHYSQWTRNQRTRYTLRQ